MEEKIMSMLEQIINRLDTIENEAKMTNKRLDNLEQGQARAEERLTRIEAKVDVIDSKLDNVEAQNANRHVEINGKLDTLAKDITFVEAVAGKNMQDIANIKLVK